jgi:hypothetical protein
MKYFKFKILLIISLLAVSCVSKFIPETNESDEAVVVDGLITNEPGTDTIKLFTSIPLGKKARAEPVEGCTVILNDDLGNSYELNETKPGIYITDQEEFCGAVGRIYTLKILSGINSPKKYSYESFPVEMKPVPPIDTLWYEKVIVEEEDQYHNAREGCNIYLDTHDPLDECHYYRWDYTETWEMRIPYDVPNKQCWVTEKSGNIMIKNTSFLSENRIAGFPLHSISYKTDRLNIKYSIQANQYSLNVDEYVYWEKIQNIVEEVGSLYDITPASIPGNMYCVEDPNVKVLGYFSVSAKSSKRIFIQDHFSAQADIYLECPVDTVSSGKVIPGLGLFMWIIGYTIPNRDIILTDNINCYDCTKRGTKIKPPFWQ